MTIEIKQRESVFIDLSTNYVNDANTSCSYSLFTDDGTAIIDTVLIDANLDRTYWNLRIPYSATISLLGKYKLVVYEYNEITGYAAYIYTTTIDISIQYFNH